MYNSINEKYKFLYGQLNKETRQHSENVAGICAAIARSLEIEEYNAYKIGLLHDVGKMFIPSRILKKNEGLTPIEREVVDLHAYFGYRLLKENGEPPNIYLPVLYHHGFGKHQPIVNGEPITEAILRCIFMIHSVDIYEAMTRKRAYHDPFPEEDIYKILSADALCTESIIECIRDYSSKMMFPVQKTDFGYPNDIIISGTIGGALC